MPWSYQMTLQDLYEYSRTQTSVAKTLSKERFGKSLVYDIQLLN